MKCMFTSPSKNLIMQSPIFGFLIAHKKKTYHIILIQLYYKEPETMATEFK